MARPRTPHSPTDSALVQLEVAIGARPEQVPLIRVGFFHLLARIDPAHRRFLEDKFHEVEKAGHSSPEFREKIRKEISDWQDVQFPVKGKTA
jgi:hypothetical protein